MSTTERKEEFGVTHAPGSSDALADETGDRRVDDGVREVDLQLVEPRLRLRSTVRAPGRAGASAAWYLRVGVVEGLFGNELTLEQVA